MKRENIIINSIVKKFENVEYVGQPPTQKLKSIEVNFDYDIIADAKVGLWTKKPLSEEEIKDKIIEVLQ